MSSEGDPCARSSQLIKWPHFDGYGFNLHAEKAKPGQYIGKVDEGSPAEAAGLKPGDRIVEVNGVNISNENHKQVVQRIKAVESETRLLVVDAEADAFFKSRGIVIKSSMSGVKMLSSPIPSTDNGHDTNGDADRHSQTSERSSHSSASINQTQTSDKASSLNGSNGASPPADRREQTNGGGSDRSSPDSAIDREEDKRTSSPSSSSKSPSPSGLNLNMSVQQMRERLSQRKKYDAKKEQMDMKQKHQIVQAL